ncbi:hypothetical protein PS898_03124 [Pseudomonas fluorescens]|nr:hypothetical protein PS898_03124 [Pseudomonas fluorescens]
MKPMRNMAWVLLCATTLWQAKRHFEKSASSLLRLTPKVASRFHQFQYYELEDPMLHG